MSWLYQPLMAASLFSGGTLIEADAIINNEYLLKIISDNIITLESSVLLNTQNVLNNEALLRVLSVLTSENSVDFTTPTYHTWTCPAGVTEIQIYLFGSGQPGSNGTQGVSGGNGGRGGDFVFKLLSVTPGNTYYIYIGNGGSLSTVGNSDFTTIYAFANGGDQTGTNDGDDIYIGTAGTSNSGLTGGNGGGCGGSSANASGQSGGTGSYPGGDGGNGSYDSDGEDGVFPGGGGGGGGGDPVFNVIDNEIQRITFNTDRANFHTTYGFTITYQTSTINNIMPSDDASTISSNLNAITELSGDLTVTTGSNYIDVEFGGDSAGLNVDTFGYNDSQLEIFANTINMTTTTNGVAPVNEQQVIYLGGATTGTFDINSVTVSTLDLTGIQSCLDTLFGSGNTSVTDNGTNFTVEFINSLAAQDITEMSVTSNSTDGSPYVSTNTQGITGINQVITLTLTDNPTQGELRYSIGGNYSSYFNCTDSSPASLSGWTGGGSSNNWTLTRDTQEANEVTFFAEEGASLLLKAGSITSITTIQAADSYYNSINGGSSGNGRCLIIYNTPIECICPLVENLLSVISSNVLNLEYQLKVNDDNDINIEWVAETEGGSVTADLVLLIEHLCGIQAEETVQDEWLVKINKDNNISIEYVLNAANSNAVTLEHLLGVTFNSNQNIESLGLLTKTSDSLLEYLLNTNTSLLVNSENLQGINSNNLTVCIEHLLKLNADLISYLEHIINLNISSTLNLEHLTNIANQIVILNEFLLKNRTDDELQNEFLLLVSKLDLINVENEETINSISTDFILNYEYVTSTNITDILSVEYLEEIRSNIQLNIEQGLHLESNKPLLLEHLLKLSNDLVYNAESLKLVEANYTTLIEHLLKLQADLVFNSDINLQLSKTMTTNIESLLSVYIDRQTVYEYLGQIDSSLQLNNEFAQKLNADKDLLLEYNLLLNKSLTSNYDFTLLTSSDYLINVEYLTKIINDMIINIDIAPEDLSNVIPLLVWILKTRKKVYILSDNSARNNLWQKVARKYNLVLPDKAYTYFLKGRNFSWRL